MKSFESQYGKRLTVDVFTGDVSLDVSDPTLNRSTDVLLDPNTARLLGLALIRAADAAEESDESRP